MAGSGANPKQDRDRLLVLLREKAYQKKEIVLSSGKTSEFYVDCKPVTLDPEGLVLIGRLLLGSISAFETEAKQTIVGVGGLTLGADPLACAVALTSHLEGRSIPAFIVRKEAKGHGTQAWIEGTQNLDDGAAIAIVEDVVTSGSSALKAAEKMKDAGYRVPLILTLVDRNEGGKEAIDRSGAQLRALFERKDF